MPVQVPSLKRFDVPDEASVGRIEARAPNVIEAAKPQQQAADNLVEDGAKMAQAVITNRAKTQGDRASTEYHMWYEDSLNNIKVSKGDPAPLYAKLREDADNKKREINQKYSGADTTAGSLGLNEEVSQYVNRGLQETDSRFFDKVSTSRTVQQSKFAGETGNAKSQVERQNAVDSVSHGVKRDDPNAFVGFKLAMDKNYDARITQFLADGRAKETFNEDGSHKGYDLLPSAQHQLADDNSKMVEESIKVLSSTGMTDDAAYLKEKFGQHLLGHDVPKLNKQLETDRVKAEANQHFLQIKGLPADKVDAYLEKHVKDPEVAKKIMADQASYITHNKANIKAQQDTNFDAGLRVVADGMAKGEIRTINDLDNNAAVSGLRDKMSEKQWEALQHKVVAPKDSNPNAQTAMREIFSKHNPDYPNGFEGLDEKVFQEKLAGLSSSDRRTWEREYKDANHQTQAEGRYLKSSMTSLLTKELKANNYISNTNNLSAKDKGKLNDAVNELLNEMNRYPPSSNEAARNDYVRKFVADKKKKQVFDPPQGSYLSRGKSTVKIFSPAEVTAAWIKENGRNLTDKDAASWDALNRKMNGK